MDSNIPTSEEVRAKLGALTYGQVQRLSELSGVPFTTLWNMRASASMNPRIDTVNRFFHHIDAVREETASAAAGA